jgi:hypothetical protein
MRNQIRRFQKNKTDSIMSEEQVKRLVDIGFVINAKRGRDSKEFVGKKNEKLMATFHEMFTALKEFKAIHGHTTVPDRRDGGNKVGPLRQWIIHMRREYTSLKAGKPTALTPKMIAEMTELGFDFNTNVRVNFDHRSLEFFEFRTKYGHDPRRETDSEKEHSLAVWVRYTNKQTNMKK